MAKGHWDTAAPLQYITGELWWSGRLSTSRSYCDGCHAYRAWHPIASRRALARSAMSFNSFDVLFLFLVVVELFWPCRRASGSPGCDSSRAAAALMVRRSQL